MHSRAVFVFLLSFYAVFCFGQADSAKSHRSFYIEPELMAGMIGPNYEPYPSTGLKKTLVLNFGSTNIDDKYWAKYYNHPDIGVSLTLSDLGNQSVFGEEMDLMPYIIFNTSRKLKNSWFIKMGMGASYFTRHYDSVTNPQDLAIGSTITWAFKLFFYHSLWTTKKMTFRIGGGYCHSSDGHTQLPNLGLNSGLIGITAQFRNHPIDPNYLFPEKVTEDIPDNYFLQIREGAGFHARGSPFKPVGGPKYGVGSDAISGGVILKNHIKLRAGFTYRDYGKLLDYTDQQYTAWQSSNIFFSVGCEFLVGHIGMDIEGGINLYKPFYRQFYQTYEGSTASTFYFLKSTFPMRLGLNYYLIDPAKNTRYNVFAGADIDANFGQADFSELSLGCTVRL
jgi:Lipid A 3-O-deacylase (PagL)